MKEYLYCSDCGSLFPVDDAGDRYASCDEDSRRPWEHIISCPVCGSEELVVAGKCESCGGPCLPDSELCEECTDGLYDIMDKAFEKAMDYTGKDYTASRVVLLDFIERVWM